MNVPPIIQRIEKALARKKQVILYDPPGTGKTYWAEKVACELAALWNFKQPFETLAPFQQSLIYSDHRSGYVRMCCFHPAYQYEDFVEGFRPEPQHGQMFYILRDGIFKRLCREALGNPEHRFYLIIDEINLHVLKSQSDGFGH